MGRLYLLGKKNMSRKEKVYRIRKSTLAGQFSRINRAYHHIRRLKAPQRMSVMRFGELVAEKLDFFNFRFIKSKLFT